MKKGQIIRSYALLHLIVFIWGFTAVLGELISIGAIRLVWVRTIVAALCCAAYILFSGVGGFKVSRKTLLKYMLGGFFITAHWIAFFSSIKVSDLSVTLIALSTETFIAAILEPLWYRRRLQWYELIFGLIIIGGIEIIFLGHGQYQQGLILGVIGSLFAVLFSLMNRQLVREHNPSQIAFYELLFGFLMLCGYFFFTGEFTLDLLVLNGMDWLYLLILGSVCTAFAFIASIKVMRHLTPYTVIITTNLETVYGIVMGVLIFGKSDLITTNFYIGSAIILLAILGETYVKTHKAHKA